MSAAINRVPGAKRWSPAPLQRSRHSCLVPLAYYASERRTGRRGQQQQPVGEARPVSEGFQGSFSAFSGQGGSGREGEQEQQPPGDGEGRRLFRKDQLMPPRDDGDGAGPSSRRRQDSPGAPYYDSVRSMPGGRDGASRADSSRSASSRSGTDAPYGSGFRRGTRFGSARSSPPSASAAALGTIPIVRERDGDKGTFFSGVSFRDLGVLPELIAALRGLGINRPSHVQVEAFRALAGRGGGGGGGRSRSTSHVALADQAGSGKTLAYVLPLVHNLKAAEQAAGGKPLTRPNAPSVIILAPTNELVQQVYRVAKALSQAGAKFKSAAMTGGQTDTNERQRSWRTQKDTLDAGVDVVVATPGRLLDHLQRGHLSLDACTALVMDEADVLLGDRAAFKEQVAPLQAAAPPGMRFVLVTATLPQHILAQLTEAFPGLTAAFGPSLHRTASGLTEELVDCSGGDEVSLESGVLRKLDALAAALQRHRAQRVIVFCNKIESCRDVENFLKRRDDGGAQYAVLAYHEAIREDLRATYLRQFLASVPSSSSAASGGGGAAAGGSRTMILVCTDRTSRGLDSMYCEHVVLFDFPRDPSEYVRRVGRTARGAGGQGVVSVLVLGKQVALAQDVINRNRKGIPVHSVPELPQQPY